jgi:hypothetical protein
LWLHATEVKDPDIIPVITLDEFKREQNADPDLKVLIKFLKERKEPSDYELCIESRLCKILANQFQRLTINLNGVLVRNRLDSDLKVLDDQMIVPKSLVERLITLYHATPTAGHFGIRRTLSSLKLKYYWPKMLPDVQNYINRCEVCLKRKGPYVRGQNYHPTVQYGFPMECIYLDTCEISPTSPAGYKYVISAIDSFTKYSWSRPLKTQSGKQVAQFLWEDILCPFGTCRYLKTDLDQTMMSNVLKYLCKLFQITRPLKIAYNPESRGQIETYHYGIQTYLAKVVTGNQDPSWENDVNMYLFAYRNIPHSATRITPYQAMFGRNVLAPIDLVATDEPILGQMQNRENIIHALKEQAILIERYVRSHFDKPIVVDSPLQIGNHKLPVFQAQQAIWYKTPIKERDKRKLDCPWQKAIVIQKLLQSPVTYIIRLESGKRILAHVKRIGVRFPD